MKLKNAAIAAQSATLPKTAKAVLEQMMDEGATTAEQINAATMALGKALIGAAQGAV